MGLSLRNIGRKITDFAGGVERQLNPFDNGATYSNPGPVAAAQQSIQNANQQLNQPGGARYGVLANPQTRQQFTQGQVVAPTGDSTLSVTKPNSNPWNNVVDVAKGIPAAFGVNAAIDTTRLGLGELTNNQTAIDNATTNLSKSLPQFLPVAGAEAVKPFAQSVASAALSPINEHYANQEAERAQRLLTPTYGQNNAEIAAGNIKQDFEQGLLAKSGITPTDSGGEITRKVGGQAVTAGANILMNAELPGIGGSIARTAPTFGGLNAASALGQVAQQDNPTAHDYVSQGVSAGLTGALLPVAFKGGEYALGQGIKAAQNRAPLNEVGAVGKNVNEPNIPVATPSSKPKVALKTNEATPVPQEFNVKDYVKQQLDEQKAAATGPSNRLARAKESFVTKAIDSLAPIEKPIVKAVGREGELKLRNQLDRSLRSDTIAGQYIKDTGLHDIIQNVPNPKAFDQYLIAKHAQELERNGVRTGRNLPKDQQLIDSLAPQFEPHAQALMEYNRNLLDKTVDYGLISKDAANYLKQKYPDYVPFDRIFTDAELQGQKGNGSGPASLSTQTVIQRIKGSDRAIQPPMESILAKTHDVIAQGERNQAAQTLVSFKDLPDNPLGLRELSPSESIGTKPTISYLENGVKHTFETTPEVAAAAKSLNKQQMNIVLKTLSYPTRVLRLGATGANAAFALANVAKDTATAFINSSHPLRASAANPKVFLEALSASFHHGGKSYGELVREGAGGTSFDIARDSAKQSVKQIRADKNIGTKSLYTVTHPAQLLRAVEDTIGRSEEFGRAVQYFGNKEAALKAGKSLEEAKAYGADAARNNTVNFARAGEYGRVVNTVVPYLNAGVQGSRTLLRNLKERPAQTSAKLVMTTFMPIAAVTAWNLNSPERKKAYDNISEYEKQNNIIIVPPNPKQDDSGRWNVIKIPVSQEVANLGNIVRNGVEALAKDKGFDFAAMAGDLAGTATSLNAQNPRQLAGQLMPQAVKPIVEVATNRNLFTGQQIVPDALKNLSPEDQANSNTSGTAKVLGRLTNTSPLQIDNAVRTVTGGLGQNIVNASDTLLAKTGVIQPDEVKGKSLPTAIANRFNSAQGQTPGSLYFSTLQDVAKEQKIGGKDLNLLNSLTAKEIDSNGKPILQDEKDALNNNSILANNPRVAEARAATAKKLAKTQGKPLDPLYELTPEQQNLYYKMNASIYKSQDYERFAKEAKDWLPDFQTRRADYFESLKLPAPENSKKVQYPLTKDQRVQVNDYFKLTDPSQRSAYLENNPQVNDYLEALSKYGNDKRAAQGAAPLDTFPSAPPELKAILKTFNSLPKNDGPKGGSKTRYLWMKNHPQEAAAMNQFFTQAALYDLEGNATEAQFKDTGLDQKGLKDIVSLSKNIGKVTDENGNTFYALGGNGPGGSGGFGGKNYAKSNPTANPYKYNVSMKAKSSIPTSKAPKVTAKLGKAKVGRVAISKPKVATKKSLV